MLNGGSSNERGGGGGADRPYSTRNLNDDNLDSSQTKENFYKEEFMRQLKLMDQPPPVNPSNLFYQPLYQALTSSQANGGSQILSNVLNLHRQTSSDQPLNIPMPTTAQDQLNHRLGQSMEASANMSLHAQGLSIKQLGKAQVGMGMGVSGMTDEGFDPMEAYQFMTSKNLLAKGVFEELTQLKQLLISESYLKPRPEESDQETTTGDTIGEESAKASSEIVSPGQTQPLEKALGSNMQRLMRFKIQKEIAEQINEEERAKFQKAQQHMAHFLDELSAEQKDFNFHSPSFSHKLTENMGNGIKQFCTQLLERKKHQPRDLNNLQSSNLVSLQLGASNGTNGGGGGGATANNNQLLQHQQRAKREERERFEAKEKELADKLDAIRLRKRVNNLEGIRPLEIGIEQIFSMGLDARFNDKDGTITLARENASSVSPVRVGGGGGKGGNESSSQVSKRDFKAEISQKKKELSQLLLINSKNGVDNMAGRRKEKLYSKFVEDLFSEQPEIESWIDAKENIPSLDVPERKSEGQVDREGDADDAAGEAIDPSPSQNGMEQIEIADFQVFRDLGPYSRELILPTTTTMRVRKERKQRRRIQKRILENHIAIESQQQSLSEEMYLLVISGLVPLDMIVNRINALNRRDAYLKSLVVAQSDPNAAKNSESYGKSKEKGGGGKAMTRQPTLLGMGMLECKLIDTSPSSASATDSSLSSEESPRLSKVSPPKRGIANLSRKNQQSPQRNGERIQESTGQKNELNRDAAKALAKKIRDFRPSLLNEDEEEQVDEESYEVKQSKNSHGVGGGGGVKASRKLKLSKQLEESQSDEGEYEHEKENSEEHEMAMEEDGSEEASQSPRSKGAQSHSRRSKQMNGFGSTLGSAYQMSSRRESKDAVLQGLLSKKLNDGLENQHQNRSAQPAKGISEEERMRQEYINILKQGNRKRGGRHDSISSSNERRGFVKIGLEKVNQNELSVISEVNQSAVDQSMTKEMLKAFNNSRANYIGGQNLSESPPLRLKNGRAISPQDPFQIRLQNGDLMPQISVQSMPNLPTECEIQILEKIRQIDELRSAKRQLETDQEKLTKSVQKKQTQNLKNVERMRNELNKRIELHLEQIIKILDKFAQEMLEDDDPMQQRDELAQLISNETILKCSVIQSEDIEETVKARFLSRLVREYRKNRERMKQEQLKEQVEKEIEENIYKRFPSLGTSPDRASKRSGSRGDSAFRITLNNSRYYNPNNNNSNSISYYQHQNMSNSLQSRGAQMQSQSPPQRHQGNDKSKSKVKMFEKEDISRMKKGWGVNQSRNYGTRQSNTFSFQHGQSGKESHSGKGAATTNSNATPFFSDAQQPPPPNILFLQNQKQLRPPPVQKVNHFRNSKGNQVQTQVEKRGGFAKQVQSQKGGGKGGQQVDKAQRQKNQRGQEGFYTHDSQPYGSESYSTNIKKYPMREQHITYTPHTALMAGTRRNMNTGRGFNDVNAKATKGKIINQDEQPPGLNGNSQLVSPGQGFYDQDDILNDNSDWIQGGHVASSSGLSLPLKSSSGDHHNTHNSQQNLNQRLAMAGYTQLGRAFQGGGVGGGDTTSFNTEFEDFGDDGQWVS